MDFRHEECVTHDYLDRALIGGPSCMESLVARGAFCRTDACRFSRGRWLMFSWPSVGSANPTCRAPRQKHAVCSARYVRC